MAKDRHSPPKSGAECGLARRSVSHTNNSVIFKILPLRFCLFNVFSMYGNSITIKLENTMPKTTTISVRMDADLKSNAESILSALGLTPSQAISVFYKQITFQHGLPFPVQIPERELNTVK